MSEMLEIVDDQETEDPARIDLRNAILVVQKLAPEHRSKRAADIVRVSVKCHSSEVIPFDISFTKKYLAF